MIVPSIIAGKDTFSDTPQPLVDHLGSEPYHYAAISDWATVDKACEIAHRGFSIWSSRPRAERARILMAAAEGLRKNRQQHIDAHIQIGGSPSFAELLVDTAHRDIVAYSAALAGAAGHVVESSSAELATVTRAPLGPVVAIAPWNAPSLLWERALVAPLAAGCSVVAKASEKAPLLAYLMVRELLDAGVDQDAVQLLHFAPKDHPEATERLIANRRIRKINFTGSTAVGRRIAEVAASHLKPVLLELGGKNIMLVRSDADLPAAAAAAVLSAWLHNGQICMSLDSVHVDARVYEEFVKILCEKAAEYPLRHELAIPMRDSAGAAKPAQLVADAVAQGASVVYGDGNSGPVILADVTPNMSLHATESFGPVLAVYKCTDFDSLVDDINDSNYVLKTAIWSRDVLGAMTTANRLRCAGVHINSPTVHDEPLMPHGGVGSSGSGNFNGSWGIAEFTFVKTVTATP